MHRALRRQAAQLVIGYVCFLRPCSYISRLMIFGPPEYRNEVLNGKIIDTNTQVLANLMFRRGVDLVRVETIPDVHDDIAESVVVHCSR